MDITQLILDDHHEQRRLFGLLEQIDAGDTPSLSSVWARLATFLEVHAKAEEQIFYPRLLNVRTDREGRPTPEAETEDAIKDHNEIRDAIAAVAPHAVGSPDWFRAVAEANKANSDHMGEEEREGLTDFRRGVDLATRHTLGVRFIAFEERHVDGVEPKNVPPQEYVHEHSASAAG